MCQALILNSWLTLHHFLNCTLKQLLLLLQLKPLMYTDGRDFCDDPAGRQQSWSPLGCLAQSPCSLHILRMCHDSEQPREIRGRSPQTTLLRVGWSPGPEELYLGQAGGAETCPTNRFLVVLLVSHLS